MRITNRDRQVYNFINMVGICTAQQIREVFFKGVDISKVYQRLRVLYKEELIKVYKVGLNNYYYVGKRTSKKMLEHDLKTTELIGYLIQNGAEIIYFKRNKKIGYNLKESIICDGYVAYKIRVGDKKYKRHFIIEVQRNVQFIPNKTHGALYTCIQKYNHTTVAQELNNLCAAYNFKKLPPLLVITDIKDNTTLSLNTQLIKLPYNINQDWELLIS